MSTNGFNCKSKEILYYGFESKALYLKICVLSVRLNRRRSNCTRDVFGRSVYQALIFHIVASSAFNFGRFSFTVISLFHKDGATDWVEKIARICQKTGSIATKLIDFDCKQTKIIFSHRI